MAQISWNTKSRRSYKVTPIPAWWPGDGKSYAGHRQSRHCHSSQNIEIFLGEWLNYVIYIAEQLSYGGPIIKFTLIVNTSAQKWTCLDPNDHGHLLLSSSANIAIRVWRRNYIHIDCLWYNYLPNPWFPLGLSKPSLKLGLVLTCD